MVEAAVVVAAVSDVDRKLSELDPFRLAAVRYLIDWLRDEPDAIAAMARGRHAEGHYRYGDSVMYEYDQRTLDAEAAQELADAVNYIALKLSRSPSATASGRTAHEGSPDTPPAHERDASNTPTDAEARRAGRCRCQRS